MITAAILGASAAVPASACTSDATTTVCCGVSPIAAVRCRGSPRRRACRTPRRWSGGSAASVCALDEVGVGPGEALDRRLVTLVLRADLARLREGEERGAVVPGERTDAVGDLLEPQTGRQREHGVVAAARGRGRRPARRARPTRRTRPCSRAAGRCRPGTNRRPTPSPRPGTRATNRSRRATASSSPASFVPHPGWISTVTPAPSPPGGWSCQRNQPPATRNGRTSTARTPTTAHVRRRRRARSARTRARGRRAGVPPVVPLRRGTDSVADSATGRAESPGESAGVGERRAESPANRRIRRTRAPNRSANRRIRSTRAPNRSANRSRGIRGWVGLAARPSHDSSWPPSSVGVTRAARTAERRATTAGSPPRPRRRCRRAGRAGDACPPGSRRLGGCAGRSSW